MKRKSAGSTMPTPEVKFKKLVLFWTKKVHANPERICLQEMTNKWASCSTNGRITFNTALLKKPLKFQKAVIIHEFVHLLVPNHGKLFKSMFLSFMPEGDRILKKN